MKICFLSGNISSTGGTERVGICIANELSNNKNDVTVLSMRGTDETYFDINKKVRINSLHLEKYKNVFSRKIMPYIKLFSYLKKEHFDIVICIDVIYSIYLIPMKKIIGFKLISWEHFNCHNNNGVKKRDKARRISAKKADAIVTLTKRDKNEYLKLFNVKTLIDYIPNPSISLYDNSVTKNNTVLACGRLTNVKNYQDLLEIWYMAGKNTDGWRLIICGEGEERQKLENIIKRYNLKNVELPGNVQNMGKIYNSSKIMVMTSKYEGLPMVLLEAQGCGLPIISYDCFTGPSEIIDENSGILIPLGDKERFTKSLLYLINNDNVRKNMSMNALNNSKKYDIKIIIKKWTSILKQLEKK